MVVLYEYREECTKRYGVFATIAVSEYDRSGGLWSIVCGL